MIRVSRAMARSRLPAPRAMAAAALLAATVLACGPSGPTATVPASAPLGNGAPGSSSIPGGSPLASPAASPSPSPSPSPTPAPSPTALGPAPAVRLERVAAIPKADAIANARDGSNRLFVASQSGQVWSLAGGRVGSQPILDIAGRITSGGERGLLGLAFHPRYPADQRLFVDYTDRNGNTVVSSFAATPGDPVRVDPASERVIFQQAQPFPNHNGGGLVFGPDGYLYIALGDGGSAGDPQGNGQRLDTALGKILRIDVDAPIGGGAYAIPPGNPFASRSGARPEIWLYGLRNPWRFSFDRATGDLWIGDVGQNLWEEVDVARAGTGGLNFGWVRMEGFHCYPASAPCDTSGLTLPVAEYGHGPACSITGGHVYRGLAQPALSGYYLFADYCSGVIYAFDPTGEGRREPQRVGQAGSGIAAFGEDEAGELYVANVSDGSVSRIVVAE